MNIEKTAIIALAAIVCTFILGATVSDVASIKKTGKVKPGFEVKVER